MVSKFNHVFYKSMIKSIYYISIIGIIYPLYQIVELEKYNLPLLITSILIRYFSVIMNDYERDKITFEKLVTLDLDIEEWIIVLSFVFSVCSYLLIEKNYSFYPRSLLVIFTFIYFISFEKYSHYYKS